jgi:hypothetical protein
MNKSIELILAWVPFLLMIGLWLWFGRKQGLLSRGSSGASMIQLYEQQVAETRRMNSILERIAETLEKRLSEPPAR